MNSEKKNLKSRDFPDFTVVDRQLNYKNMTLDLILIHQIHHTFKNAVLM